MLKILRTAAIAALALTFATAQALAATPMSLFLPGLPLVASATGTTGATSATLPNKTGVTTWICSFVITSGGTTSATLGNATVSGLLGGTLNFTYVYVSSGQGLLGIVLPACLPAADNQTAIVVTAPAGGAGTTVAVTALGFQGP